MAKAVLSMIFNKKHILLTMLFFIFFYLIIHLNTLISFPYIHSDEAWLSGFSRTVLDKGTFKTTEPFFDLYPRPIHGLRVIFVGLQILFIKSFGYSILTMRSLSLCFSLGCLYVVYIIFRQQGHNDVISFLCTGLIAIMPQFIMASHVARQEPMILFAMLLTYSLAIKDYSQKNLLLTTLVIGLCIGIHPNSFIIGICIGIIYLYHLFNSKIHPTVLLKYIILLSGFAGIFITISYLLNPNFVADYLAFGNQLGVVNHTLNRFEGFYYYYYKLYHQIGGTYVLLNIKVDLIITAIAIIFGSLTSIIYHTKKTTTPLTSSLLMLIGVNIGLLIIGRYNQTAVIFTLFWGWITFIELLKFYCSTFNNNQLFYFILTVFLVIQGYHLYQTISPLNHQDYNQLGESIAEKIPEDSILLGNLNLDYHFPLYQLYDIRNLDYLEKYDLSISSYIQRNGINYILLYDEMDYINEADHKWNILYGDLSYYDALQQYIKLHGTLIDTFDAPTYGMRISKYVDVYPWTIKLYHLE